MVKYISFLFLTTKITVMQLILQSDIISSMYVLQEGESQREKWGLRDIKHLFQFLFYIFFWLSQFLFYDTIIVFIWCVYKLKYLDLT